MRDLRDIARRALACLDLTNLDERCDAAAVETLCARARTPRGPVAAVCVWPAFVTQARTALAGSGVRVATVVNFPRGEDPMATVIAETSRALAGGAEEIDLVLPWRALARGEGERARDLTRAVKAICGAAPLKTILETGELGAPDLVARASREALAGGADFLKTSTGKVPVNATPEAAEIMLGAIRDAGRPVGFKAAGGVRTTRDAAIYLDLAERVMGADWPVPERFRIGASGLLDALLATLDEGGAAGEKADGDSPY
ncbi:deoxyribose-phosphate aldolase [Amaricoccus solimangrovi]|uniref:Deoxyribose-phosphate aldolase n=1 Tax=Amaricoccus solimangrovi TaxID=2589815 RepID=A0A501WTF9_9RHOB|nr:deoxyribose-phosphate aldolase [Amaricoccus solimangrovi]TPE53013.1 deoxyribose-phosphate aldolase [Amaricoccus solimangrovi]